MVGVGKYDPAAVFAGYRLVAVSVADTGRDPVDCADSTEAVEVGATVFDDGTVGETRTWLVRPVRPITVWATRAHGIGNLEVARAPKLVEVAEQVGAVLAGRIVVAVRALHVRDLIASALSDWTPPRLVDLQRVSPLVWPWCSQALGALELQARVSVPGRLGRARHDAPATAAVFLAIARRMRWSAERMFRPGTVWEDPAVAWLGVPDGQVVQ